MLSRLPVGHELRIGRHKNGVGFFAEIFECDRTRKPIAWEGVSHGHTSEQAITNALDRFTGQSETLYQAKDFDL